jgi:hypothetical protein
MTHDIFAIDVPLSNYIRRATGGGMRIATARDTLPALRSNPTLLLSDWFRLEAQKYLIPVGAGMHKEPIHARIEYGRWLVLCPVCKGANDVHPGEPVYLCTSCGWPENLVPVLFPEKRIEIERLLIKRPIHNRNWQPGETVADLVLQNLQHGCEV